MKIAYIITGLGIGGAERVTIDIANKIVQSGNDVIIIHLTENNASQKHVNEKIKVYSLNMRKTAGSFIKALLKARKILNDFRPDIVHGQMYHANIFARILRLTVKIPKLICSEHSKNIEGSLRMFLYGISDFLSDLNTNVSKESTKYFTDKKSFGKTKSRTVYNGIDLSKFAFNKEARDKIRNQYDISETEFLFLNVGRLVEAKDQKALIEAFSLLVAKERNVKLMVVGQGELLKELEFSAAKNNVDDKVIFTGMKENIADFYSAGDCFVLSSAWEGFPLSLIEAMSAGMVIISTDAGGGNEFLGNSEFVVPAKNVRALYEKMKNVLSIRKESKEHFEETGKQNIAESKKYDIDFITKQWLEIYTSSNR